MSTDENGLIVVTLDDPKDMIDGAVVVTLDWLDDMIDGEIVITLDDDTVPPVVPVDEVIYLDVQEYCYPGNKKYTIYLPAQTYILEPLGGGCNDYVLGSNYWTWHMACSVGEIGGTWSMLWSGGVSMGATPEAAYATVVGQFIVFNWPGGEFELWIPANDVGPFPDLLNDGGLRVRIRSVGYA